MTTPKRPPSNPNHSTMDTLLESLITVVTDHSSIDDSIDRIIESKSTDSEQNDLIQRAIDIGSVVFEAGNRMRRKRASAHNALVWPLPYDVTVKVFSMIDTQSVCNVAAACSFFHKCTTDPLCFANIDLVNNAKVNDAVVSTMIQRAGNSIQWNKWNLTLESVSRHCTLLERLIFETSPAERDDGLKYSTSSEFVLNCPNITTLALKGFKVPDSMAHELVKGRHKLKYVDFSTSSSFTGAFLKNLGTIGGGNNLEVMVKQFMAALVAGEWRSLRHLDISHTNDRKRYSFFRPFRTSSIRKQLLEQRLNFRLVAEFGNSEIEESSDESDEDNPV